MVRPIFQPRRAVHVRRTRTRHRIRIETSDGNLARPDVANGEGSENDPVFAQEQQHLSDTYATLQSMAGALAVKMRKNEDAAAATKQQMVEEIKQNYGSDTEAFETYADFATVNSVIDSYNQTQDAAAEKLSNIGLLLSQPYFAKIVLDFKRGAAPKELYIGAAGVSDDSCRRLVVDWRSPVAEVYYNQENGATSYEANGRTIKVNLLNRRQFDIEGKRFARISTPMSPSRTRCCCNRFPHSAPST